MNQMTELSTLKQPDFREEWPENALPLKWMEVLFSKMSAFYGARFADAWRGTNPVEVQKAWAVELAKLSKAQLKAGSDNLTALVKAPTLPEFIAHCKQARVEAAASTAPQLENGVRASAETVGAAMPQIRQAAARAARLVGSVAWAFDMVSTGRARNGSSLTAEVLRHAEDAVLSGSGAQAAYRNDEFAKIRASVIHKRNEVAA
ncbi:hypothetical protein QCE63_32215 [Caballeronia sp. LZ065]|uniref:hypothetical protein n=1 Tax=Caballeronia sp. LZ065 TaxID=3038571 RepID=UPI00285EBF16|nr:hypothetical protein [Caballeronia sp. LZ065]MDR5784087.1 hypothetical protein [Caballeronia sp. LZ065]